MAEITLESANGGTIFLDEIGDLPAEIQIALLLVLQEREIEHVGGNNSIHVDARVLAATHRDLNALVAEGRFREDLLYRLNVVPIEVPPLRERVADIPLLVEYFIDRFGKRAGKKFKTINKNPLKAFQAYQWPGNVRELQNVIERAVTVHRISRVFAPVLVRPAAVPLKTTLQWTLVRGPIWLGTALFLTVRWYRQWRTLRGVARGARRLSYAYRIPLLSSDANIEPMSAAGRKAIAQAQRKRWAAKKASS